LSAASVTVELRSVNGRFLDLGFRLPDEFRSLEPALRDLLTGNFRRGKIELRLNTKTETDTAWPNPQPEQMNRLSHLESTIQGWLPKAQALSVHEVMQWCKGGAPAERLDEVALDAAKRCVAGLAEARAREGEKLVAVLMERVTRLRELATQAEPLVPAVVERQQQRFLERWAEALKATGGHEATSSAGSVPTEALRERAMNEAATFALRIDVAEELSRLRAHLEEIARLLKGGGELGKHCGLVAGARSDIEHALRAPERERFADPRDHVRLRDRLAGADRQRRIVVRAVAQVGRHEQLARDTFHRREHAVVRDIAVAQLALHHPGSGFRVRRQCSGARAGRRAARRRGAG
jgi:uncharacterized protein (TIGR00255 family)